MISGAVFVSSWLGLVASAAPEPFVPPRPSIVLSPPSHHSVLPYDGATPTTLDGTITGLLWQNPHALIRLEVRDATGALERWTVESEGATALTRLGWTTDALRVGTRIRTVGARARDGRHMLRCRSVTLPDGRALPCFPQTGRAPARD